MSRFSVTFFTSVFSCESTHLSAIVSEAGRPGRKSSGRFIITKRAAFHSLLAKLRLAFTFSSEKRMSLPGVEPTTSVRRSASAPYWSMISSGSMPLPKDLDILRPCASRTRPWMSTVSKGALSVYVSPEKIMRLTQNVMMSYPVTSVLVG